MKRKLGALLIGLLAVTFIFGATSAFALSVKNGDVAPTFTLKDLDDKPINISEYKGKVVLLAFWASWCPRCIEELKFLKGLYEKNKNDMIVVAVNQDTKNLSKAHLDKLKAEVAELNLGFPIVLDLEFDVWKSYGINALPTSVIIDREGVIAYAEPNYYWASEDRINSVLFKLGIGKVDLEKK